ncbi:hypothetical protein P4O66_002430 [Electrophorus voltai]|uniref:t-SNARE coiled-coil homology domain-containing protein n=1 Tax=Electrophorus voltai TaxID=2609070 RepID=A0AAD8YX47_9TELE|nr:hypothetical protein P4O66_002430 [Electrophorus voltai]
MKDRFDELRQCMKDSQGQRGDDNPVTHHHEDEDNVSPLGPQAVVFEAEPVLKHFLEEARRVGDGIDELEAEVRKISQQQKNLVATMLRLSVMRKESSVVQSIKLQAESLHKQLNGLSSRADHAEAELGASVTTVRIQRTQHAALFHRFQSVMRRYNDALMSKQDKCKRFIVRQLEVAGQEVSEVEVENMMEQGKWDVFTENILLDVKITRTQLSEIEQRHKELVTLESNMKELSDLFLAVFMLVEEQGVQIDNIQANVEKTQDYVVVTNEKFKIASRYKRRNPLRRLCCCCCPCISS